MARFGITSWLGDGTGGNPFIPRGIDGPRAVIDLRPDPTVGAGVCLYIADAVTTNQVTRDLGEESLDSPLSNPAARWIENNLGVTLAGSTLREVIAELLILWGEADLPGRTKWKRLLATSDGRHRIVMRDRVIYDALAPVGATVSDDFNRADEALAVSANWNDIVIFGGDSTFSIVSNVALAQGTSTAFGEWNANFGTAQWAQANASGINNAQAGLILRCSDPSNNLYMGYWRGGNDAWRIAKTVSASFSVLAEDTGGPASLSSNVLYFVANGSTLTLRVDGVQKLQTTDTSITNLRIGIMGLRDSSTGSLDNFQGGDITSQTVTPSAIVATVTIPQATAVTPTGDATATPAAIAATTTIPQAVPQASSTVTPAAIAATTTLPQAVPVASSTSTPTAILATVNIPQATAGAATSVSPAAIAATVTVPQAVPTAGAEATPAAVVLTAFIVQATLEAAASVTPTSFLVTLALPAVGAVGVVTTIRHRQGSVTASGRQGSVRATIRQGDSD